MSSHFINRKIWQILSASKYFEWSFLTSSGNRLKSTIPLRTYFISNGCKASQPVKTSSSMALLQQTLASPHHHVQNNPQLNVQRYAHSDKNLPEISEDDLEETFTRGHGPGGQSVNKTTNCCVLKHVPTGLTVKVHETRSLYDNRKIARLRLREKLDLHINGNQSQRELEKKEESRKLKEKKKRTNERLAKLRAFKEREGL